MEYIDKNNIFTCLNYSEKSISTLAKETNLSRSTLYNILTGKTYPNYLTLHTIAVAMKLSQEDFIKVFFSTIEFNNISVIS